MLTWIPAAASNPGGPGAPGNLLITNNDVITRTLFCPTARRVDSDGAGKDEPSARTQTTTFARGYREVTTIRSNGSSPMRMRRIVFCGKGLIQRWAPLTGPSLDSVRLYTSSGYVRQTVQLNGSSIVAVEEMLFRGNSGTDWASPFNAKTDPTRLVILSDKTYNHNPSAPGGKTTLLKNWYGLNKTLVYDDDEDATTMDASEFAQQGRIGMGDVFVYDIYQAVPNNDTTLPTTTYIVNHEGSYYWHER